MLYSGSSKELEISQKQIEPIIDKALAEDLGGGDITTEMLIPPYLQGKAALLAKDNGIIAGNEVADIVFHRIDPLLQFDSLISDGEQVKHGDTIATIEGSIAGILKAERTALNFMQRLSGIATETYRYVEAVKGTKVHILDTRKTTPGLRLLEKYAVKTGGGYNHRFYLGDQVLIKDNHLDILVSQGMSLEEIITQAKQRTPSGFKIEVEVKNVEEASQAAQTGVDIIMLDNMSLAEMSEAVEIIAGRAKIEASGGITLDNVRMVAETGVDFISVGALTHSVCALDISLLLKS